MFEKLHDKFVDERTVGGTASTPTRYWCRTSRRRLIRQRRTKAETKAKKLQTKVDAEGDLTDTTTMDGIISDAAAKSPPEVVIFIVHDLPNRDCHAKASDGEICGTCLPNGRSNYFVPGGIALRAGASTSPSTSTIL